MPTKLADIAGQLNISPTIVSRVLNNKPGSWASKELRQRITTTAELLNYRPSAAGRALATGRTMQIAISAYDHEWDKVQRGRMLQMRGLIDSVGIHGYSVLVTPSTTKDSIYAHFEDLISSDKCDGICVYAEEVDRSVYELLLHRNIPFIVIGNPGDPSLPQIDHDNYHDMYGCVQWLWNEGHRRIAFIVPSSSAEGPAPHVELLKDGYKHAHLKLNGSYDSELLFQDPKTMEDAIDFLRGSGAPTAIVLSSLPMIVRWLMIVQKAGIAIPDDLVILARLDLAEQESLARAGICDGLACTTFDWRGIGYAAGSVLMKWINTAERPLQSILIPSQPAGWYSS